MIINKIICDRCGRETNLDEGARLTVTWYALNGVGCEHEMCASCVEELHKWIEEGKREE